MIERKRRMPVYGYARVSSKDQTLAAQRDALRQAGAVKVYSEKISGDGRHRPGLARLLKALEPGDQVVVTRLDRLARSTLDLLVTLDHVAKAGAKFKSLADAWCDTSTAHGRLLVTVLGSLAEFERTLILERTSEGRKRAKARGVHIGRPFKLTLHQRREARQRHDAGETLVDIGRSFNVSHMTVARALESVQ
jgi:DNA invertase Pin-like site-specific DNA recombinase